MRRQLEQHAVLLGHRLALGAVCDDYLRAARCDDRGKLARGREAGAAATGKLRGSDLAYELGGRQQGQLSVHCRVPGTMSTSVTPFPSVPSRIVPLPAAAKARSTATARRGAAVRLEVVAATVVGLNPSSDGGVPERSAHALPRGPTGSHSASAIAPAAVAPTASSRI